MLLTAFLIEGTKHDKKLTQHGNSWALVIDKPVLDS